jgi:alpha-ketoglutarate-dependent taurine dioxygenase
MVRLHTTAGHLVPFATSAHRELRRSDEPLRWAPISPLVQPWGRLLTYAEPLTELLSDDDHAAAIRAELIEHGVVCFRPSPGSKLLTAAEFTQVLGRLNPGAQSDVDAVARMKTYESTPTDPSTDAAEAETLDCPKAHVDDWPNVRLLGSERDAGTGRAKQLLCETGYEWHTDNVGPAQTALYCRQPLRAGGETLFTSAARMYELLTPQQKRELESLVAVHSNRFTAGGPSAFDCHHGLRMNALGTEVVRPAHTQRPSWTLGSASGPLLERHSITGVPYLVVVAKNLERIEGMSVEASRRKLTELMLAGLGGKPDASQMGMLDWEGSDGLTIGKTHFNPAFVYEHRWQAGDLVVVRLSFLPPSHCRATRCVMYTPR